MAPSLDAELEERFLAIAKCRRTAWLAGDIAEAERRFLESWDMIPEPKSSYDHAQSSSYGIAVFYRDTAQFEKARAWAMVARDIYGKGETASVSMDELAATIQFESGDLDGAYTVFEPQYRKYGRRVFEGHKKGSLISSRAGRKLERWISKPLASSHPLQILIHAWRGSTAPSGSRGVPAYRCDAITHPSQRCAYDNNRTIPSLTVSPNGQSCPKINP